MWYDITSIESEFTTIDTKGNPITVHPLEQTFEEIRTRIKLIEEQNKWLKEENKKLKDKHYKDKELDRLQKQLEKEREDFRRGFLITKSEQKKIDNWKEKHIKKKHWDSVNNCALSCGALGGRFKYEFLPTSIGICGIIKCNCGEEFTFKKLD